MEVLFTVLYNGDVVCFSLMTVPIFKIVVFHVHNDDPIVWIHFSLKQTVYFCLLLAQTAVITRHVWSLTSISWTYASNMFVLWCKFSLLWRNWSNHTITDHLVWIFVWHQKILFSILTDKPCVKKNKKSYQLCRMSLDLTYLKPHRYKPIISSVFGSNLSHRTLYRILYQVSNKNLILIEWIFHVETKKSPLDTSFTKESGYVGKFFINLENM